jgi:antitoxin (DNA-binding transcriptional repressor) of toxin-antitoxin stability system
MEKSVGEASRNVSKLIEAAERGENVIITRRGKPVVKIVRFQQNKRRPLGFFRGKVREIDPNWWHPMSDEEADAFIEGRY